MTLLERGTTPAPPTDSVVEPAEDGERARRRRDRVVVVLVLAAATATLATATLLGKPLLAPTLWCALFLVPVLLGRPRALLALLVVAEIANLGDFAGDHGLPNVVMALVVLGGCVVAGAWLRHGRHPATSSLLVAAVLFLVVRVLTALVAMDAAQAQQGATALLRDILVIALLLALCVQLDAVRLVAVTAVVTASVICGLDVLREFVIGDQVTFGGLLRPASIVDVGLSVPRHTGPVSDYNFWGRILLIMVPLALALFADRAAGNRRWWWMVALGLLMAGIYLTGSRGAFLSVGVAVLAWAAVSGLRYRRLLLLAPLSAAFLLVPGVGSRLASVLDVGTTATAVEDASLTGRISALRVGWIMVRDNPLTGVGLGNFSSAYPAYQRLYGIDGPVLAPHNLYLQMAAESGLPGLLAWLVFFGTGVLLAIRARLLLRWMDPAGELSGDVLLAGGAVSALLAWAVCGVVLHAENLQTVAVPLVIGAALDLSARRRTAHRLGAEHWSPGLLIAAARRAPRRPRPRFLLPVAVFAVVAALGMAVPGVLRTSWSATAEVHVVVAPGAPPVDAYGVEVLSRRPLNSTYLVALTTPAAVAAGKAAASDRGAPPDAVSIGVGTTSDPTDLIVTASAPTPDAASAAVEATSRVGTERMAALRPLFTLERGAINPPVAGVEAPPARIGLVVLVAAGAAMGSAWSRRRRTSSTAVDRQLRDA